MKTFGDAQAVGQAGEYLVGAVIAHELGWPYRMQSMADLGIDGEIEVLTDDGTSEGSLLKVQVKATSEGELTAYVEPRDYDYWRVLALPVIVCRVVLSTRTVYWLPASAGRRTSAQVAYDFTQNNQLSASDAAVLRTLARRPGLNLLLGLAESTQREVDEILGTPPIVTLIDEHAAERHRAALRQCMSLVAAIGVLRSLLPELETTEGKEAYDRLVESRNALVRLANHLGRIADD
jgi:hypothetical protein